MGDREDGPYRGAETTDCSPELTSAAFPRRRASPWSLWAGAGQRLGPDSASSGGSRGAAPGWVAGPRPGARCPPPPARTGSSAPRVTWRACGGRAAPSAGSAGAAARSAHLFCPERARGLGDQNWDLPGVSLYKQRGSEGSQWLRALRESAFTETRELRTFSGVRRLPVRNATSLQGCGLPQDRSRCLRTARAEHLPPPWVSIPSIEAAREGKERSNSPVCQPGLRSPGLCRPPPTSLFSSFLTLLGLPRQHLYRYWIAPCGLIPIHTTWRASAYLRRSTQGNDWRRWAAARSPGGWCGEWRQLLRYRSAGAVPDAALRAGPEVRFRAKNFPTPSRSSASGLT